MSSGYQPDKPKVVPMVHERPKMPAKTWSALRSHILADRKKKREKEGKQKEEERLKRERESRKKQEANNLEETKEQITMLEDKLSSLKEEKHQLFLTLKKVLNEDDVRRKKDNEMNASLYGQPHASNVLPMSGHVAQQTPTSRYIQPGQGLQQRQAMYRAAGLPPVSLHHAQAIKRIRSPSPPPASIYSRPSSTYSAPSYIPPLITTQATAGHAPASRDLLKEAVSQGLGLGVTPRERELLGALGGGHGLNRDMIAAMGPVEREMLAKTLATGGSGHSQADAINLAAAAAKESETYARYLAAFTQQLEGGNKTALSELDRARLVNQASSSSLPRPGYYSDPSRAFPSPR